MTAADGDAREVGDLATAVTRGEQLLRTNARLAEAQARAILAAIPGQPQGLLILAEARRRQGDAAGADAVYTRYIDASVRDPALMAAASALAGNRLAEAERRLRERIGRHPTDVAALRMLGELGARLGRYPEAEKLLGWCLEIAPGFDAARHHYAIVLHHQTRPIEALAQLEPLLGREPDNPNYLTLKAAALVRLGGYPEAIALYERVLAGHPEEAKAWMSYAHALKTVGRREESIAAYRRSLALEPSLGETYWSLANLKTFRFEAEEVGAMRVQLARTDLDEDDRLHLHYALGKALEDAAEYEESFTHYALGAAIRRRRLDYDPDEIGAHVTRSKTIFTPAFFAARAGAGCPARDPIFILGLPRSGSTLLEQILASHSMVEGTMELPDIPALAKRLGHQKHKDDERSYPQELAAMDPAGLAALGEDYLRTTRIQRKTDRPFFVDKMPNNFAHVGLIHAILPNARIIDARRHPMACCFSGFKQHFARGHAFSYDLEEIGRFYRDYVELMAHYDTALPGRVHRVIHEALIADPEGEIRRLLDYCGLPFEATCLKFHENDRAVRTPSAEQVRLPIFTDGLDHWRHYEPWLGPLKSALGPVLDAYPAVPRLGKMHDHTP